MLPIISNFIPLVTQSLSGNSAYINFWGTTTIIAGTTTTYPNNPLGWTLLGLSPIIMFLIFAILGIIGIIIGADGMKKFIPTNKIGGAHFLGLVGIIIGIIDLIMVVLIFIGDSNNDSTFGFSPAIPGASLGLGYYLLIISAILIIIGAIVNFVVKPKST